MRGRTNLPPRMGGAVNGNTIQCIVSDKSVNIGDFVEFVEGSGIIDTEANVLPTTVMGWAFGPFILSDETIATFYFYNKQFGVRQSSVAISGFINEGVKTTFDLSGLGSPTPENTNYDDLYVLELEQDSFLLMISDMGDGGFAHITYDDGTWNLTAISSNAEFVNGSFDTTDSVMCSIDQTHVAISVDNKVYIGVLSNDSLTFGSPTTLSEPSGGVYATILNGYLVILKRSSCATLSIDTELLSSSIVDSISVSTLYSPTKGCTTKLDDTRIIVINSNQDNYLSAMLITVNNSGRISSSINTQAITMSGSRSGTIYASQDGRLLLVVLPNSNRGYVYASTGYYDASAGTVIFEKPTLQNNANTDWIKSSSEFGAWYLSPIKLNNGLVYGVVAVGTNTRQFIAKLEQNKIVQLSDNIYVKEYTSTINGIAKGAGTEGSTIEVYVPQALS